jgi:hypothetical protein
MGRLRRWAFSKGERPYNHATPAPANAGKLRHVWRRLQKTVAPAAQHTPKRHDLALRLHIEKALEAKAGHDNAHHFRAWT